MGFARKTPRRRPHLWTDEDAAYAAAQWASGIRMKDVAAVFGYVSASSACGPILNFTRKYYPTKSEWWHDEFARVWNNGSPYHAPIFSNDPVAVKAALAEFVKQRNALGGHDASQ